MRGVGVSISTESTGLFPWKMGTEVTGLQGGPGGHRALVWGVCTQVQAAERNLAGASEEAMVRKLALWDGPSPTTLKLCLNQ